MEAEKLEKMRRIIFQTNFNRTAAVRLYQETYPDDIPAPSRQSFRRLAERLEREGNVARRRRNVRRNDDDLIENIRLIIHENPRQSVRQIARQTRNSKSTVHRAMKHLQLYPYRVEKHQQLYFQDLERRRIFCTWAIARITEDANFFKKVLFTDEATVSNTGGINKHNYRYWATANPHWLREIPHQYQWKLNVWCGIVGDHIIGPHFFEDTLTGGIYADFLRNILPTLLENIPLDIRMHLWYQQDGAPAHRTRICVNLINYKYPLKWIGLGGPIEWPARSPDLSPLDFFLWGRIKDKVYASAPTTRQNMRQRIIDACASINVEELRNVQASIINRLNMCVNENGGHFEH